ncbi:DUF814 domain-containing protein [Candidatus Woesearchaeota archaeon]|nr:DUF814 domain-containing protein [Candidatus Woesearchaeota archaeon]
MQIELDTSKTVEQNAAYYFERAKKARKKIEGVKKALARFEIEKQNLISKKDEALKKYEKQAAEKKKEKRTKEWYEKFRWFISSEGFLCIGGRDATTNEIVIKKHMLKEDLVFHTEAPGSPFFVVKTSGKKVGEMTLKETATATAIYSKAWKMGLGSARVYWIKPPQVRKELGLPKGSFMIHGKRNYFEPVLEMAVGITEKGLVMGGPISAVKKNCTDYIELVQGSEKKSDIAKKIKKEIGGKIDDIISVLPAGEFGIKK